MDNGASHCSADEGKGPIHAEHAWSFVRISTRYSTISWRIRSYEASAERADSADRSTLVVLGQRLLATSLLDGFEANHTLTFIADNLDCVDAQAKRFYRQFDFQELPGYPMRLYLPCKSLEALASEFEVRSEPRASNGGPDSPQRQP